MCGSEERIPKPSTGPRDPLGLASVLTHHSPVAPRTTLATRFRVSEDPGRPEEGERRGRRRAGTLARNRPLVGTHVLPGSLRGAM